AVERKERERSENVKVRLNAPAGKVDEQRGCKRLTDRNGVARHRAAGVADGEENWRDADQTSDNDGRPDMRMDSALSAGPCLRRDDERGNDSPDPLERH